MDKFQIIPAILATTEEEYQEKLQNINESREFEWVQIDLMDNKFVQNQSITSEIIAKYPTKLKIEAHLMVEYPENWIDELINVVDRIIFPVEDSSGILERIKHIKNHNVQVGLSLNPETSADVLEAHLGEVDAILVMSVNPGFGGQKFIPDVLTKIAQIKQSNPNVLIGVDGGIGAENAKLVVDKGADYLVIGSYLLKSNISENIEKIKKSIGSK